MAGNSIGTAGAALLAAAVLAATAASSSASGAHAGHERGYGYPTTDERRITASSSPYYKEIHWVR